MSRLAVMGAGYVGLTTAACLADLGNQVAVVDIDEERIRALRRNRVPFYEPGLQEIVERNRRAERLTFTESYRTGLKGAEYAFIAVGTPTAADGRADVSMVEASARSIAEFHEGPLVVINKSTVPIGTGDLVSNVMKECGRGDFDVASNPEFLREGSAVQDFMKPDRVVIGAHSRDVADRVAKLYEPLNARLVITTIYSAEMIKYAANAFLATRISFINEVARICERVDADVKVVAEGMGLDRRIGPDYLEAGLGYGGSCLPKDVRALYAIAETYDLHPELLGAVMQINADQRKLAVQKVRECLGTVRNQVVGLLGLGFKPNTSDLRDAPSLEIARDLLSKGATVRAYDPAGAEIARRLLPELDVRRSPYALARGADALLVVTEWNEFRQLDLQRLRRAMRRPVIVDGRNIYDPAGMQAMGFVYRGIGRS